MIRRKRRRLCNKVSEDFGGSIQEPLLRYLKTLGDKEELRGDYVFWGYPEVLEFSKAISGGSSGDLRVVLGHNKALTDHLEKYVFLMYSKAGYPDTLILVTHEDDGTLVYHSTVGYDVIS